MNRLLRPLRAPLPLAAALVALALAAGCTPPEGGARLDTGQAANTLSSAEIREIVARNPGAVVYDVLRQERPRWFSRRSITNPLWVYETGGVRIGEAETILRRVNIGQLDRVEYLPAISATGRFGSGHEAGAIVIYYRI